MSFEFYSDNGTWVPVRSIRTIAQLVRDGSIGPATMLREDGDADAITAGEHVKTSHLFESLMDIEVPRSPSPVNTGVSTEIARRATVLTNAVANLEPLISFLITRKKEGGDVAFRLTPPKTLDGTDVTGILYCAGLRPESGRGSETYSVIVSEDGYITLAWPLEEVLEEDERMEWLKTYKAEEINIAVQEAEFREELERSSAPSDFTI